MLIHLAACAILVAAPCHAVTHTVDVGMSCLPWCAGIERQEVAVVSPASQTLLFALIDQSETFEAPSEHTLAPVVTLSNAGPAPQPVPPPHEDRTPGVLFGVVLALAVLATVLAPKRRRRRRRRRSLQIFFYSRYRDPYVTF